MGRVELSGCTIINDKEELLLLWKKKHNHYEFPGGKVEPGETLEEAAIRECREELGVNVKIIKYIGYDDFEIEGLAFRSHRFLGTISEGEEPVINEPDKFDHLSWIPIREYERYALAPNVKQFCKKYLRGELRI